MLFLKKHRFSIHLLCIGLFLFSFLACGLETFIYLYPVDYRDIPTEDPLFNFFSFKTSDSKNSAEAGDYFKGFEIYYRIYNNSGAAANDRSQIFTYNDNNPSFAYNYLINTKNYRKMITNIHHSAVPLIPSATVNRMVTIRLLPYVDIQPSMFVDTQYYGIPRRSVPDGVNSVSALFEFDEIKEGHTDVTWGSWDDQNEKKFYIQAYVIAYGTDESFKQLYSELYYLGVVTIGE